MKRRLVYVEWEDSYEKYGWISPDKVLDHPMICFSVGWLMEEDERRIVIGSSISLINGPDDPMITGAMGIPKGSIKRLVNMKTPYRSKLPSNLT